MNDEEGRKNYRRLNNELRRTTDKAREDWWRSQCEELELLDKKGRTDIMYAQIKKITEVRKAPSSTLVERFRKRCGTREAIVVIRTLQERCLEHDQDVYVCYVDFEKAFDRVNWLILMETLKNIGVDWKDRRMIRNLYIQ